MQPNNKRKRIHVCSLFSDEESHMNMIRHEIMASMTTTTTASALMMMMMMMMLTICFVCEYVVVVCASFFFILLSHEHFFSDLIFSSSTMRLNCRSMMFDTFKQLKTNTHAQTNKQTPSMKRNLFSKCIFFSSRAFGIHMRIQILPPLPIFREVWVSVIFQQQQTSWCIILSALAAIFWFQKYLIQMVLKV